MTIIAAPCGALRSNQGKLFTVESVINHIDSCDRCYPILMNSGKSPYDLFVILRQPEHRPENWELP